jgi:hypothetical protein
VVRTQDYRKPKQAMEARREKRRGSGRPRRTWEDCVIDVARRKGKTLAGMKRLARDRIDKEDTIIKIIWKREDTENTKWNVIQVFKKQNSDNQKK